MLKNLELSQCNINITELMIFRLAMKRGKEKQGYN